MLDTPIIVSDEIPIEDDYVIFNNKPCRVVSGKDWKIPMGLMIHFEHKHFSLKKEQKIIAGIEGLPAIDWNGLEEKFEYNNKLPVHLNDYINSKHTQEECVGFIDGFKKAQSLNEKKFSLDDMEMAFEIGRNFQLTGENNQKEFLKSLQQPKVFDIEVETETKSTIPFSKDAPDRDRGYITQPKITNNSIKILRKS